MEIFPFDFETPHHCEFPVKKKWAPVEIDCGEPASHLGWWGDNYEDGWWLCQEHLDHILENEEGRGQ